MFYKLKLLHGNTCAQVFVSDIDWTRAVTVCLLATCLMDMIRLTWMSQV
jgi:hypothetical protein